MALNVTTGKGSCTFWVHVVPRSRQDAVAGLYGQALKVYLRTPPVEGKANRALESFLAERLGVPVGDVEVVAGHTSRHKVVRVQGIAPAQVRALAGEQEGE